MTHDRFGIALKVFLWNKHDHMAFDLSFFPPPHPLLGSVRMMDKNQILANG